MAPCHAWLVIFVFLAQAKLGVTIGQQCVPLKGSFRQRCEVAGYNKTFPIPYEMDPEIKELFIEFIDETITEMENCSVGLVGETIVCSLFYAPHCIEGQSQPHLPCRRVCSEYIYRCLESDKSDLYSYLTPYLYGLCTLLPNDTAATGECYEPPGFENHFNSSTSDLLQGECHPNIFPWCEDLDYDHTVLPVYLQEKLYKSSYNKNFTGNPVEDAKFSNKSWIHHLQLLVDKYPKCSTMIKKLLCAERIPPCFPGETSTLYSVCQSVCQSIIDTCPEVKTNAYLKWYLESCELIAYGNHSHGYCKHTKWPNPHDWINQEKHFGIKPTTLPPESPLGPGIIAAAVVVPIIAIILIISGVYLWRNRMLPWRYFGLKAEDRKELVT